MEGISARSWASKLVESFQNDSCESGGHGVLGLTSDEADLLEPLPLAAYPPWVVPLTIRPNDAGNETVDDSADD
jgi:hypothetical protein